MIETVYSNFGFIGSLVVSLAIFFFFIFWMAGVAGICQVNDTKGKTPYLLLFLAIIIPVYPVAWIILDMIKQKKELRRL